MNVFNKIYRVLHRKKLPVVTACCNSTDTNLFVSPNPWLQLYFHNEDGIIVGSVGVGLSPPGDRIYVDGLYVKDYLQRQGYGSSILLAVTDYFPSNSKKRIPVTPLHEVGSARDFWRYVREGGVKGLKVTQDVRVSEMPAEKMRWAALAASNR